MSSEGSHSTPGVSPPGTHSGTQTPSTDLSRLKIDRSKARVETPLSQPPGLAQSPSTLAMSAISSTKAQLIASVLLLLAGILLGRLLAPHVEPSTPDPGASSPLAESASLPLVPRGLSASGYVVAQRQAAVASQATGRLQELRVEEGDTVRTGDVLGIIENDGLQAVVRQEEAGVHNAEARLDSARASRSETLLQKSRILDLFQRKSVSTSERDAVLAAFDRAQAEVAAAEASLVLAKARLDRAKVELGYSYIRAPFDGTVLTKNADVGEVVAPFGSSANARAAIVTIADMSSLQVEADVSESNLAHVRVGQACSISLDSIPGVLYEGTVSNIVPTVDRAKATVLVKIRFANLDHQVIPEMSARVTFKE